jgi:acyl-coenzyme A synthetase/AMP-(fatty) acid ligase
VLAIVVLKDEQTVQPEELISYCGTVIAPYKKPWKVRFVDALPRTETNAKDRDRLDSMFGGGNYPPGDPNVVFDEGEDEDAR